MSTSVPEAEIPDFPPERQNICPRTGVWKLRFGGFAALWGENTAKGLGNGGVSPKKSTAILIRCVSKLRCLFGGVGGIRTLGQLLTVTRFPIVLVMTTSIPLQMESPDEPVKPRRLLYQLFEKCQPQITIFFARPPDIWGGPVLPGRAGGKRC